MKRLLSALMLLALCVAPLGAQAPATAPSKGTATREIHIVGPLYGYEQQPIPQVLESLANESQMRLFGAMFAGVTVAEPDFGPGAVGGPGAGFVPPPNPAAPVGQMVLSIDKMDISKNESTIRFTVDFSKLQIPADFPGKPGALADAMAAKFKANIENQFKQITRGVQDDLETKRKEMDRAAMKYDRARQDADQIRDALRAATHRTDLSSAAFRQSIGSLEIECQKLELDLAGMQARRDALDKAVAEQSARAAKAADADPVSEELAKIVAIRSQQVDLVKQQVAKGLATPVDLQTASVAFEEAKARLAERKLAASGQADVLSAWNRQLLDLTVDVREKEARLAAITKMLDQFSGAVEKAEAFENLFATAGQRKRELDKASDAAQQAQDTADQYNIPPKVTITPIQSSPAASS